MSVGVVGTCLMQSKTKQRRTGAIVSVFGAVTLLWLALDIATKQYFNNRFVPGDIITEPLMGLFRFRLVHNTGAAWGIFSDATGLLGFSSLIVCGGIIGFFLYNLKHISLGETFGLALVLAGGIGNAIDRFILGYVVDFIEFTFIDFPVFNIADIGVTCGFVIVFISLLIRWHHEGAHETSKDEFSDSGTDKA